MLDFLMTMEQNVDTLKIMSYIYVNKRESIVSKVCVPFPPYLDPR